LRWINFGRPQRGQQLNLIEVLVRDPRALGIRSPRPPTIRTLYFVLHGDLEVIMHSGDGLTMGRVALIGAGSLLGELAFFDGGPRSAGAWAVDDCEVAAMTPDQYTAFEQSSPALARELLFALGRILAIRLRRTTAKVVR
jgi:CRP/FNR family cyclic AMP-dependent transcriptional regulator